MIRMECPAHRDWFDAHDRSLLEEHYSHLDPLERHAFLSMLEGKLLGAEDAADLSDWHRDALAAWQSESAEHRHGVTYGRRTAPEVELVDAEFRRARGDRLAELRARHGDIAQMIRMACPVDGDWFDARDASSLQAHYLHIDLFDRGEFLATLAGKLQGADDAADLSDWHDDAQETWQRDATAERDRLEIQLHRQVNHIGTLPLAASTEPSAAIAPDALAEHLRRDWGLSAGLIAYEYRVAFSDASARLGIDAFVLNIDSAFPLDRFEDRRAWSTERERQRMYRDTLAETALTVIVAVFGCTDAVVVDRLLVNVHLRGVDPATGRDSTTCVTSVEVSRGDVAGIDFLRVQPRACLRSLNSVVPDDSRDLEAVRPIALVEALDPRFVDAVDVAAGLESRSNLMELTPSEFESLIQNLFQAMGLDTHQTQASRDGGVDAVAFDGRPVIGGKLVIQAKRYKDTVGVSAVRDLYGTMLNEGASKGILVTTSGYGRASFDFARGKPLELLDGPNLRFLLHEHLGISVIIRPPDTWDEPPHDVG